MDVLLHTFDIRNDFAPSIVPPENCFGVFVTVRRSQPLSSWPENVHGCVGDFGKNAKSREYLLDATYRVAKSATFEDDRRQYFPDILLDPKAIYEIDYMMLPRYPIDSEGNILLISTKIPFDNNKWGLIVENGRKATYLPGVFKNISWREISASLQSKAGIQQKDNKLVYYAYQIQQFKIELGALISPYILNHCLRSYLRFFNCCFFVPYAIEEGKIVAKHDEKVRNAGTLRSVIQLSQIFPLILRPEIRAFYEKQTRTLLEEETDSQSQSFLLRTPRVDSKIKRRLCSSLESQLPTMETEFEQGEVLVALAQECPEAKVNPYIAKTPATVFGKNWQAQFLAASGADLEISKINRDLLKLAADMTQDTETNELAVCWEGLTALGSQNVLLFRLWVLLLQRRTRWGLWSFTDGSIRVDISGHVVEGIQYYQDKPV